MKRSALSFQVESRRPAAVTRLRRSSLIAAAVLVAACGNTQRASGGGPAGAGGTGPGGGVGDAGHVPPPPGSPGCGLTSAAFCDTFDAPSPGGRNGDLDDAKWSVARISGDNNQGQGEYNVWGATTMEACGETKTGVLPPGDMTICSAGSTDSMHFNNSFNDAGGFTIHSYRIRQPFDFADRTGTIAFDLDAKGSIPGGHGFWFNVFVSKEPVPAPYQGGPATALFAKAGVGIEFESVCSGDFSSNSISTIILEENYTIKRQISAPSDVTPCFKTKNEVMNHIEIHISQTKIEVFASDAGEPASTMRSLWALTGISLPFSRGYVNLQHTHYNASKCTFTDSTCVDCNNHACPTFPPYATYHWDNVGFDGPVLPVPRGYEAPDNDRPEPRPNTLDKFPEPFIDTGYQLGTDGAGKDKQGFLTASSGTATPLHIKDVDLTGATSAAVTFNAWSYCDPLQYRLNGGAWKTFKNPFPDCDGGGRAVMMPVDLADLKPGDNTLEMYDDTGTGSVFAPQVANIELVVDVN